MKRSVKAFFSAIIMVLLAVPSFALYNRYGIPDSSEIRQDLVETWFEAPLSNVRMNRPEIRTNSIGEKFQIRLEETEDTFNIFVAPYARIAVDVYSDKGKSTEMQDIYPGDAAGSWLLVRDKKSGKAIRLRYYFSADSEVYVQFTPINKMAYADYVIFGCYSAKGVPTGLYFDRFYAASFEQVVRWTSGMLPWQYSKIYEDGYHANQQMLNLLKERNSSVVFTEDAMYDEDGNPVYISTGKPRKIPEEDKNKITVSGAGYLKWIADGIIEPLTGSRLKREPLIVPTVEYKDIGFQGILNDKYSISFSLDWIRNLASAVISVRSGHNYMYSESNVDVRVEPFTSEMTEKGIINSAGFIDNTGYQMQCLKALLYVLAVTEPDTMYFAAIRETDRRSPEVKVFNDCCAIFPYFDTKKCFRCVIYKDGAEMSYDEFYSRYCLDFIYLTRVQASEQFFPAE